MAVRELCCILGKGLLRQPELRKAAGRLLEDTMGGKLLKFIGENFVTVPDSVWKAASAIFASNAKGEVQVFLTEIQCPKVFLIRLKAHPNLVKQVQLVDNGDAPAVYRS